MTVTIEKTDLEVQLEICRRAVDAWRRYEESKGQQPPSQVERLRLEAEFLCSSAHHFFGGKARIPPDLLDRDLAE